MQRRKKHYIFHFNGSFFLKRGCQRRRERGGRVRVGEGGRASKAEMCRGRFGFSGIQTTALAVGCRDTLLMLAVTSLALSGGKARWRWCHDRLMWVAASDERPLGQRQPTLPLISNSLKSRLGVDESVLVVVSVLSPGPAVIPANPVACITIWDSVYMRDQNCPEENFNYLKCSQNKNTDIIKWSVVRAFLFYSPCSCFVVVGCK